MLAVHHAYYVTEMVQSIPDRQAALPVSFLFSNASSPNRMKSTKVQNPRNIQCDSAKWQYLDILQD